MDDRVTAIILAGGQGTRVRELYPDIPKLLIPACGQPFAEWILRHLSAQGIRRFVVSLGHLANVAEDYFRRRADDGLIIRTVREDEPLGTGGGFCFARETAAPDADLLVVVNGDSLVAADFGEAWRQLEDPHVDGVVLAVEMDDAARYGRVEVDRRGRLQRFLEKQPGRGLVNAGVYFFRRALCEQFPQTRPLSMELDVFPSLLAGGARIAVVRCAASFLDIGTPDSAAQVDRFIDACFGNHAVKAPHFTHLKLMTGEPSSSRSQRAVPS